jgi:hypothetical protein
MKRAEMKNYVWFTDATELAQFIAELTRQGICFAVESTATSTWRVEILGF